MCHLRPHQFNFSPFKLEVRSEIRPAGSGGQNAPLYFKHDVKQPVLFWKNLSEFTGPRPKNLDFNSFHVFQPDFWR